MKIPRILVVFLCAAGTALALAISKALVVSGLDTLPPVKVLVFAASAFGLVAALLDWALLRDLLPSAGTKPKRLGVGQGCPQNPVASMPSQTQPPHDPIIERARHRPIVFCEICPPPATTGLSFYGGLPIGPAKFAWPRLRNKPGDAPLSFIMQWDCVELAGQDATGLLPRDGVLYLFCDLTWGDPFDFEFIHAPGPVDGMQAMPIPPDLPPVYGNEGAYQVPYCSPQIAKGPPRCSAPSAEMALQADSVLLSNLTGRIVLERQRSRWRGASPRAASRGRASGQTPRRTTATVRASVCRLSARSCRHSCRGRQGT